ncbi:MAG: hypothetical protein KG003_01790 [Bacteroidetes bacterium]|nr:hypothetical protein [Bacteroidota bacterium]
MKKNLFPLISLTILCCTIVISSCKKDRSIVFVDDQSNASQWSNIITSGSDVELLKKELRQGVFSGTVYANSNNWNMVFVSSKMTLQVPGKNWKDENGNPVSGAIDVSVQLLDKAGKNIRASMPTQTADKLLYSGGSYSIEFSQNGKKVTNDGYYFLDMKGINQADYKLFEATDGNDWNEINDGVSGRDDNPWTDTTFRQDSSMFFWKDTMFRLKCKYKWVNCDQYAYNGAGKQIRLKVKLPAAFGNTNTSVFAIQEDNYGVFRLPGEFDTKLFAIPSRYTLPEGLKFRLVAVARIGDKYYYDSKVITTEENKIDSLDPVEKTKSEIMDILDNL